MEITSEIIVGIVVGIVGIVLGWLLGLLSPSIIKKISNITEQKNLKKIIFNDLNDLKIRLAPLPFQVFPKYGRLNKENFNWIKNNSSADFSNAFENYLKEGKNEEEFLNYLNEKGLKENKLRYFKKMHLFAIDSHLINLALLDSDLMARVLEVKFYIEAFNEEVDAFRENLNMTFQPGLLDINHKIISDELDKRNLRIADQAISIVDKINFILENNLSR